jgi:hypothetical protein
MWKALVDDALTAHAQAYRVQFTLACRNVLQTSELFRTIKVFIPRKRAIPSELLDRSNTGILIGRFLARKDIENNNEEGPRTHKSVFHPPLQRYGVSKVSLKAPRFLATDAIYIISAKREAKCQGSGPSGVPRLGNLHMVDHLKGDLSGP